MNLSNFYRLGNKLYNWKIPILPKLIYFFQFFLFNSSIPYKCSIGKNTKFAYGGIGVVIHQNAIIGCDCIIGQGITIGGRSKDPSVPRIGDKVYIGAGSRILGNIAIGNNVIIAPNAVLIENVPSNSIVAGIPAKIIKTNIRIEDYV